MLPVINMDYNIFLYTYIYELPYTTRSISAIKLIFITTTGEYIVEGTLKAILPSNWLTFFRINTASYFFIFTIITVGIF